MRPLGGGDGSRFLALALVVAGLLVASAVTKPWEALAPVPAGAVDPAGAATAPRGGPGGAAPGADPTADATSGDAPSTATSPACASPQSWRTATIESWFGRMARVWSAVEVGEHALEDPSLPFEPVIAERITAIGWCAPVVGPDRPPVAARGTLWRLGDEGMTLASYVRLEPERPNALGELWGPPPGTGPWEPGRYVIELRTPSGSWRRTIGIEIFTAYPDATTLPIASPPASIVPRTPGP